MAFILFHGNTNQVMLFLNHGIRARCLLPSNSPVIAYPQSADESNGDSSCLAYPNEAKFMQLHTDEA